jgi:hypothetical protein
MAGPVFLFATIPRQVLEPIWWLLGAGSQGIKKQESHADYSLLSIAEMKKS